MENNDWIFIKIFMDSIVNTERKTYKFTKNVKCRFKYFEIYIEPKLSVMPFEELLDELQITDDNVSDKFYDFVNDKLFYSHYNDETLHELFEKFTDVKVNYKAIIKILFLSLIQFECEINNIITHIEKNNALIEMTGSQIIEVVPIKKLIKVLKISETERDKFSDEILDIIDYSDNQEKDAEEFLKKYNII